MTFFLFFSDKLIPYRNQPYSGAGKYVKEYLNPSTPETAFIKEAVNKSAKSIATKFVKRLNTKGGAPEFEDSDEYSYKRIKGKGSKSNGRSGRNSKDNKRNGNGDSIFGSGLSSEQNKTRGYQVNSGTGCLLFSSGISSGLTVNTRIVDNNYSPLYLSSGYLFKVTDVNIDKITEYSNQLANIIYPLVESVISNRIQRYAGRYVNVDDYSKYISAIAEALQVYYCIDNVLAYGSNTSRDNINVGMEHIRSRLTSEALVEFNLLRELICTCVCPPNLLNYIKYMCQSFRTSDAPHASIIKLNIGGMFDEQWIQGSTKITQMIRDCRSNLVSSNKMVSYLYQAFPNWLIANPPESANVACYDKNFLTFWHNQNCCYLSTTTSNKGNFEYSIQVTNVDAYTDYQILQQDTDVDGVIFVSQTYNIAIEGKKLLNSYWGLWQPLATVDGKQISPGRPFDTFNIKCFGLEGVIVSVTNKIALGSAGIYNLVVYSGTAGNYTAEQTKFGTHGFVKLQNVSVRMQSEAFNNTMRHLFM